MNPARRGLSNAAKTGAIVLVAVVVLAGVYLYPSLSGVSSTSSTPSKGPLTYDSLFGYFSHLTVNIALDTSQQPQGTYQTQTISYSVLGREQWNLTEHTKVMFSQPGAGHTVVALFDPSGKVDRIDVLSENQNQTTIGPGAAALSQIYTGALGLVVQTSNNATLLAMLNESSQNMTTFGSVQLNVTTYRLAVPTGQFKHVTLELASIPGAPQRLAVYLDEKTTYQSELMMQVTSLSK